MQLAQHKNLLIKQVHELGEWFGFETRNKYQIFDEAMNPIGFAAEGQKGILGLILRQFLGHWRPFEIHIYDQNRQPVLVAKHPFRIWFQRLEVYDVQSKLLGVIQQRFSILTKRFDVQNAQGMTVMEVASPFWKLWTFPFMHQGKQMACILKKWSGLFFEAMTDRDTFKVEFTEPSLSNEEKQVLVAAAVFIDLQYFEKKAGR